jgi:aldehyde dehydrogenase
MERVIARTRDIKQGNPLDPTTMVGAQVSREQFEKIMGYLEVGRQEGAEVLIGGSQATVEGFEGGFFIQPTFLKGSNDMRVFQEEIFGPVVGIATFRTEEEALAMANNTDYGLGAGVWTRDTNRAYRVARGIQAGRVWMNCYHAYPPHAAFGGYKKSGIGRECHKSTLEHYQQTKNLLVSYSDSPLGFF